MDLAQRQLVRSVGLVDLDDVFVTHFHADHVLGPPGLRQLFKVLGPLIGKPGFDVRLDELDPGDKLDRDGYVMEAFPVAHRVPAYGYALIEDDRPGRFDEARARELGVAPGPDFGRAVRHDARGGGRGRPARPRGDVHARGTLIGPYWACGTRSASAWPPGTWP